MLKKTSQLLLLIVAVGLFSSCVDQAPPPEQAQVFGQPESTIPWNTPQRWEGQAGAMNAMRGEEGY